MKNDQKKLEEQLKLEKKINTFLYSEVNELKKINSGLKSAYDDAINYKNDAIYYQQIVEKYQNYYPYIEKFRKSFIFKILKKAKGRK